MLRDVDPSVKFGQSCTTIGAWDDAITYSYLEKGLTITESIEDDSLGNQLNGVAKQSLGNTYIEKYEALPERNDELIRKALFWSEAAFNLQNSKGSVNLALYLDLAQEHYFLVTRRKPMLRSRDTWTGQCNWGHHIVKHVI